MVDIGSLFHPFADLRYVLRLWNIQFRLWNSQLQLMYSQLRGWFCLDLWFWFWVQLLRFFCQRVVRGEDGVNRNFTVMFIVISKAIVAITIIESNDRLLLDGVHRLYLRCDHFGSNRHGLCLCLSML